MLSTPVTMAAVETMRPYSAAWPVRSTTGRRSWAGIRTNRGTDANRPASACVTGPAGASVVFGGMHAATAAGEVGGERGEQPIAIRPDARCGIAHGVDLVAVARDPQVEQRAAVDHGADPVDCEVDHRPVDMDHRPAAAHQRRRQRGG
ncbi:MAG: hypothetical protein E6J90_28795 [Deltaproteobacteria bacterium]|nr:MAG: hypothetical protein E6J90_28795 [Deltaproteobacteria bacterium]